MTAEIRAWVAGLIAAAALVHAPIELSDEVGDLWSYALALAPAGWAYDV